MSMEIDQNIFYDEFKAKLQSLENSLIDLRDDITNKELINDIFRSIHTIKGAADLLFMFDVVSLSHKSEDILSEIREDKKRLNIDLINLLFEFKEYIALVVYNTSCGIFDDEATQNLAIYFNTEFEKVLNGEYGTFEDDVKQKTILVVDESTIIRYMIKNIAVSKGYNVLMSDNGIDGLHKIHTNDIDIVFSTVNKECVEIKDMINGIKNDILYDHITIVMLVDKMDFTLQEYGKKIHAKAWLSRPIDENKLLLVLDKLLEK
ncbi:MAG: Hpt domain-containing protein [Campylobacterota bacterium]|nr:Hpt domain-containing protein [Campylobacterota bacterium]